VTDKRKASIAWTIVLIVLLGVGLLFWHTLSSANASSKDDSASENKAFTVKGDTIAVADDAMAAAGIKVIPIVKSNTPFTLTLTARSGLNMDTVTHVSALFGGKVVDISAGLGQKVDGPESPNGPTKLCVIESNDLAQAKANWLQSLIQVTIDQDELTRSKELYAANVLAEKFLMDAESQLMKDQASQEAARQQLLIFGLKDSEIDAIRKEASLQAATVKSGASPTTRESKTTEQIRRERMGYVLTAPRSGVIAEKFVAGGETAVPQTNLFTIADTKQLWVWGDVYERDLDKVKVGQPMKVYFTSEPTRARDCTINWISPVLDPNTHSIKIRGVLDNSDGRLLSDMYGTMLVTIDSGLNSIVVPSDAVVRVGNEAFVFVQIGSADGKTQFRKTPVTVESVGVGFGTIDAAAVGPAAQTDAGNGSVVQVRITSGLSPGQTIVKSGTLGLFNEMAQHSN
jgi:cobalt-zinc-cadmium efflux system membrane fusion protein